MQYEEGLSGRQKDYLEALFWYKNAANQGHSGAMNNIAAIYLSSKGVKRDPEIAFEWFGKSAKAENKKGMFNLAMLYYMGDGTKQDYKKANEWFLKAVKKGDVLLIMEAMKMENNIMSEKDGVVKSIKVAVGDAVLQEDVLLEIE